MIIKGVVSLLLLLRWLRLRVMLLLLLLLLHRRDHARGHHLKRRNNLWTMLRRLRWYTESPRRHGLVKAGEVHVQGLIDARRVMVRRRLLRREMI